MRQIRRERIKIAKMAEWDWQGGIPVYFHVVSALAFLLFTPSSTGDSWLRKTLTGVAAHWG
jgi:hypothetical protein